MEILFAIVFLLICGVVVFIIQYWWILLIFVGMLFLAAIIYLIFRNIELKQLRNDVVGAEIISREPIVKQVCENTGHTTSYGRYLSYHEHYRNRNVITGYKVKFKVIFNNGSCKIIECNENSGDYKILITKMEFSKPKNVSKPIHSTNITNISLSQQNALRQAKTYLASSEFSYQGLVKQLEYEKYPHIDAVYAADNCGANWNEQAIKKAKSYLLNSAYSREGLIQQLEYEGFTHEQAVYGVTGVGY